MNWLQRASKDATEDQPVAVVRDDPQSIRRRVQEQETFEKMADAMRAKVPVPDNDDARRVRQGIRRRDTK